MTMKGFRRTPQRMAIVNFLKGNTSHPSAEDIHCALKKSFPTLSLATVYNTLETLGGMGKIVDMEIDSGKKRFDPAVAPHHHLICMNCRKIRDIPEKYKPALTEKEKKGFRVVRSQVVFYGICPLCRNEIKG